MSETITDNADLELVRALGEARESILREVGHRVVGQREVVEQLLVCLFAEGHALFVGVPGLAKTLLVRTLAEVLDLSTNRIQFTPDLMPSDITGTDVLEEDPETGRRRFRFVPGPVFTQILLADEINRTPPKTQAALLQSMAEHQVTASGRTHDLPKPYLVFATQNPIDQEGTYPLPEAQLDRFFMQIDVDYPDAEEELEVVRRTTSPSTARPSKVLSAERILAMQSLVPRIPASDSVARFAVALVRASRPDDATAIDLVRSHVAYGAGPRASQALVLGAKARAALHGRFVAEHDDVRAMAHPILRHRLVMGFRARADAVEPEHVVKKLLEHVKP